MKKLAILTLIFCIVMMFATACFQSNTGNGGEGGEGGSGEQGGEGGSGEQGGEGGSGEQGGESGGEQGGEPGGDQPGGDQPGGDEPGGDEPGGDEPGGDTPGGDTPGGDTPGGDEPGGDTPGGDEPGGDEPVEVVKPAAPGADVFASAPSAELGFDFGGEHVDEEAYGEATSANGWKATGSKILSGVENELFGSSEDFAVVFSGNPATAGSLTSGLLGNGLASFSFDYGFIYPADTQFSITITVYQLVEGEIEAVATHVVEKTELEADTKYSYTWTLEEKISGNFVIQIANNCLSGEKDRVGLWNLSWTGVVPAALDFDCMPIKEALEMDNQGKNNSYAIVDKAGDGNRVLKLVKTNQDDEGNVVGSGTNEFRKNMRVYQYVNSKEEGANKAVFTAKFFVEELGGADPAFEFFLRGGNGLGETETKMTESPNFLECTAKNAPEGKILCNQNAAGTTFEMPIGEWIDIRIEYTITNTNDKGTKATGIKVEYFMNGESKLVGTSIYGKDLEPNGGATPVPFADEITHMVFILYTNNIGVYYFDDMSLSLVKDETVAPPVAAAPCEHRDADDDQKCDKCGDDFDDGEDAPLIVESFNDMEEFVATDFFNSGVDGSTNATAALVDKGEGDKAMYLDKIGATGVRFFRKATYTEEGATQFVYSFDFKVENVTSSGGAAASLSNEVYLYKGSDTKAYYILLSTSSEGNFVLSPNGANSVDTGIKADVWTNFKFVYSDETKAVNVYVNGDLVCTNDICKVAGGVTVADLYAGVIWFGGSRLMDAYFDNVSVVKTIDKSVEKFNGETIPEGYTAATNAEKGSVTVVDAGDGNKALLLSKVNGDGTTTSVTVNTVNAAEENANTSVIAFDILYTDVTAAGAIEFWVYNASGGEIALPYFIVTGKDAGSAIKIIDLRNRGIEGVESGIVVGTWASVEFRFDSADGSWDFYVNGDLKFSGLLSSNASAPAMVGSFRLSMDNASGAKCYIDNVKFHHVYEEPAPVVSDYAKKFDGEFAILTPDNSAIAYEFTFTPDKDNGNNGTMVVVDNINGDYSGTFTYAIDENNAVVVKAADGTDVSNRLMFGMNMGGGITFANASVIRNQTDLIPADQVVLPENPGEGGEGGETGGEEGGEDEVVSGAFTAPAEGFPGSTFEDGVLPSFVSATASDAANTAAVVDKGEGNKAIHVAKTASGSSLSVYYDNVDDTEENADATVVMFDFSWENNAGGNGVEVYPRVNGTKPFLLYLSVVDNKLQLQVNAGNKYILGDATVAYRFTFIYIASSQTLMIAANNELVCTENTTWQGAAAPANGTIDSIQFFFGGSTKADFYLDNITLANVSMGGSNGGESGSGTVVETPVE